MDRRLPSALLLLVFACPLASAQAPVPSNASRPGVEAIGPKQDDPRSAGIIVQGGLVAPGGCEGTPGVLAIGPKQDDPSRPGALAIGPKQDDPSRPGASARPGDDNDPKSAGPRARAAGSGLATGRRVLAIGPKQDDPSRPGAAMRPGDDNDPKARCVPTGR